MSVPTETEAELLRCQDLSAAMTFFGDSLGFRIDTISPADNPTAAIMSRAASNGRHSVMLTTLPDGIPEIGGALDVPDGAPVFTHTAAAQDWGSGRASMQYRDLIAHRQGGRFIASHIQIPGGGPVPDYEHFHDIRFQMIFVHRGWVRLVYEDQGEPFVMQAGDCVLQPPLIRHRVLESSPGLEVVEIGCPARHDTHAEHNITLPTGELRPDRDFGGQRFVLHTAAHTAWELDGASTFQDTGISNATGGLAGARVVRFGRVTETEIAAATEFRFWFVRAGSAEVRVDGVTILLAADHAVTFPDAPTTLLSSSPDFEVLEVVLPG